MPDEQILFPAPDSDWEKVKQQLMQLGCSLLNIYEYDNESFSAWDLPDGQGELDFVVDLTVDLGYFVVRDMPEQMKRVLSNSIGLMSNAQIEQFFQDNDPLRRRQAIRMASLLGDDSFVDAVMRLCHDLDPQVTHEAKIFCSETLGQSVNDTADAVQLFESTLNPRDRRQILRWLLQDFSQCNTGIEAVVVSALVDVDWEVRVSAIIAAARYKLRAQARTIAECSLEPGPGQKIHKRDKEIIHGIRQVALLLLSGQEIKQPSPDSLKQARWWRLYRAVAGNNDGVLDTLQVTVDYFAKPHPACIGTPTDVPGLNYTNQQIFLANTSIELQWVPALPHILGDEFSDDNPLRIVSPDTGFFISRFPLLNDEDEPHAVQIGARQEQVEGLIEQTGLTVTVPSREQWEMALRGADGRLYPWGWGFETDWMLCASPWGVSYYWSDLGELCVHNNELLIVGKTGWHFSDRARAEMQGQTTKTNMRIVFEPVNPSTMQ